MFPYRTESRPRADPSAMVRGDRFRITVLTDGLLRLEYSDDGVFEDRASAFALFRDLPVPDYRVIDGPQHLEILTSRVHLVYDRGPLRASGLSIQVRGNISAYHSVWRFGDGGANLGGTARTLDNADGAVDLEPGVLSRQGYAVLDDSLTPVLDGTGWIHPRNGERTDLYFFGYGRDYRDAVRALYAVSGSTPVLPRFALGTWWSRYHRYTAEEYLALMDSFAEAGIRFSIAVLDMDWHVVEVDPAHGSGWTGYSWNRALFPDPEGFLRNLHERGLRVTLNVHPADGVRVFEEKYPDMARALGRDPAAGDPIAFDVTDPAFLAAYFDVLHRSLERQGVDFWWIDWQSGSQSRIAGIDPLWMLNHFHSLDSARDGRRPLTLSRYAGPGSHRYPVGFSGDTVVSWDSLDFQPCFTATASNIGYGWWSHDIGGHMFGAKDDELATRWVQLGAFSPIMRLHSGNSPFNTKEPWRFGRQAQSIMIRYLRLRHRLLPYLHTMNHRAARDGEPLVHPMYWSYPEMPQAYQVPNQFTFGTELLVAPITRPGHRRLLMGSVLAWLPTGRWIDIFTGLVYDGDREVVLHRRLDDIPVLARAGAIVPLTADAVPGNEWDRNESDNPVGLEVLVVVGADGSFELIEDDGTGSGRDAVTVARTPITYDHDRGTVSIGPAAGALACIPQRRDWWITFPGLADDGTPTASVNGSRASSTVSTGNGRTRISVPGIPTTKIVTVTLWPGPVLAPNDVAARLFTLLDAAQIEFSVKERIQATATCGQSPAVRLSRLQALALDEDLQTAVGEILLAAGSMGDPTPSN